MASTNPPIVVFNGGILGEELHSRVDIPSYQSGCAVMENFRPRLQGPMTRRPSMLHIDLFSDHSQKGAGYEFVQAAANPFLVRHTTDGFAFYLDGERITIPSVTASLQAGAWTNASALPASINLLGSILWLDANGAADAIARKTITTANINTLHVLAFDILRGPLNIRIGTTAGGRDLMHYTRLAEGAYRLAFTPTATVSYLDFWHEENAGRALSDTVSVLSGTTEYSLPSPYAEAALLALDYEQIRDILYMTHEDYWPRRLERRGQYSWSIVKHLPGDGPWGDLNTTNVSIAPSNTQGEIILTASEDLFSESDVGVLFKLTGSGQTRSANATSGDVATGGLKVTGAGAGNSTAVPPGAGTTSGPDGAAAGGGGWQDGGGGNGGDGGGGEGF